MPEKERVTYQVKELDNLWVDEITRLNLIYNRKPVSAISTPLLIEFLSYCGEDVPSFVTPETILPQPDE